MKTSLNDEAEFVIVGTGAGGAAAARVLTEAGHSVILIEEGAFNAPKDRPRELVDALAMSFRSMATMATDSIVPMPLLQGRGVGGSTAINSGIIWRTPQDVRDQWTREFGLGGLVDDGLDRTFVTMEDELGVGATHPDVAGMNNMLMQRAAEKLGLPGHVIQRNTKGCEGNNRCLQGCPIGARQSMEVSYIPRAIERGARLHTRCQAERILFEGKRAVGVQGAVSDAEGRITGRFDVRASRGVIVAASALFSPLLLKKSGVRHPLLGERFQAHPGAAFVARFDAPVNMGFGASQGYEVPMRDRGFKLESLGLPPDMLAARLPGAGREWQERVAELGHYAQWGSIVRMEAMGSVRASFFDRISVRYEPTKNDLLKVREALLLVGKLMFTAGATEIYPGLACMPEIVKSEEAFVRAMPETLKRGDVHLVASHLFGTVCASRDPKRGVVDEHLAVHDRESLYVMDASVFPTNLGVNPQHTIMGLVWRASEKLSERTLERRAA